MGGHQKETTTGGQEELRGASLDGEPSMAVDESARRRELALRQHAFFQLRLHIRRGTNLVAMDRCGKKKKQTNLNSQNFKFNYLSNTYFIKFSILQEQVILTSRSSAPDACYTSHERFIEI